MIKVFERIALSADVSGKDVILAGKVKSVTEIKTSKAGNKYCSVTLAGKVFDPEIEEELDEEYRVLFLDKNSKNYGPQLCATQVEKMKVKAGSYVAIRATENITVKDDDSEETTYFGSRIAYTNGTRFNYHFGKRGEEASVVIGVASINQLENGVRTLSVPLRMWDKDLQENYTAWVSVEGALITDELLNSLEPKPAPTEEDPNHVIRPTVAVVFEKLNEEEENGRTAKLSGKATSIVPVG